ncbi:uncharacterized protein [Physcomitrium patens]|uniref:uncharacterized protein isoform X3 n=1 Tax=Physcomitrium patens TaxID=3218 RepID=UPI000D16D260|nr:uncharacterized protein LOC112277244 isoform X3 [Physcomitrium patens]|eukprot:XP_024365123.1 uncharacterized protein LOC112277244 isoform X3 [Physcomitrella patens]
MAWRGLQDDFQLAWNLTSFLRNFTGVVESCVVLALCLVHYIAFRALRSSRLNAPCSSPTRSRKDMNDTEHTDTLPKVAMGGFAESVTSDGVVDCRLGQLSNASMADSRYEGGGDENKPSYCSSIRNSKDEEQVGRDRDQDLKDKDLYETLQCERETLATLYSELEQERNCSASAASEALAMISRLQEEKASVQLEARQFQRMVLEKAMFDQEAIEALNELLMNREEEKLALVQEIHLCRERLDSLMKDERRQSLKPKAIAQAPNLNQNEKVMVTSNAAKEEQVKCVVKFSPMKSQLYEALFPDAGRSTEAEFEKTLIGVKSTVAGCENNPLVPICNVTTNVEESDLSNEEKSETTGYPSLRRIWGIQDVSLNAKEETKEGRRIQENRLSVQEFIRMFEQQQQGARLPGLQSVTKPKSGGPRSEMRNCDVAESTVSMSWRKYEDSSRGFTSDHSMRRRLFQEICDDERDLNGFLSLEKAEVRASSHQRRSCVGINKSVHCEVPKGTGGKEECLEDALFVQDVHEVQRSRVRGPFMRGDGCFLNLIDAEMHPTTPSDRLGKPDLYSFERDEEMDCESELDPLCLIPPSRFYQCVDDADQVSQWEDLQGNVRTKNLGVSSSLWGDNTRSGVEEQVEQLTHRLKALESDKYLMKQMIESLSVENGEMKLAHQLREPGLTQQHELWSKRLPVPLQFQSMVPFALMRETFQVHLNNSGMPEKIQRNGIPRRALCRIESSSSTITPRPTRNMLNSHKESRGGYSLYRFVSQDR